MALRERLRGVGRRLVEGRRRAWVTDGRAWIEARPLVDGESERLAEAVARRFADVPGVRWARLNGPLARVVVACDEGCDARELAREVAAAEAELGVDRRPFAVDPPPHPGDREPVRRLWAELAADAASVFGGLALRATAARRNGAQVDLAAALRILDGVPQVRRALDHRLGAALTDLALQLSNAATAAALQGATGPLVDASYRALRLWELRAVARAWELREPDLGSAPEAHPAAPVDRPPRPSELPGGPIEAWSDKAVVAALGGFGAGVAATHQFESAAALLFSGIPKPARMARNAWASTFAARLAAEGFVVRRPEALRCLDRIDTVVVDARLLAPSGGEIGEAARTLVAAIRATGLRLVAAGDETVVEWAEPDAVVAADVDAVQHQRVRHGVIVVWRGGSPLLAAADVAVGVPGAIPAWEADLLAPTEDGAALVVAAVPLARKAARQGVQVATFDALAGLVMTLERTAPRTTRRAMLVSNLASVLAMANGVRVARRVRRPPTVGRRDHTPWHALEAGAVLDRLRTSAEGRSAETRPAPVGEAPLPTLAETFPDELATPFTPMLATGAALSALSGSALDEQKVRLVDALERQGHTVGMTGDGANDAAAIRLADVGIALGARATPAARRSRWRSAPTSTATSPGARP